MMSPNNLSNLVDRLEKGEQSVAQDILKSYFHGADVASLLHLLCSNKLEVAKTAAWVASELGERAAPIAPRIAPFLRTGDRYVRFFLLDVALVCAQRSDSETLVAAAELIRSPDTALCRKAVIFVSNASVEQLEGIVDGSQGSGLFMLYRWIVSMSQPNAKLVEIEERLSSDDQTTRLFAVAAAARNQHTRPDLLLAAQESRDAEIRLLAREHLRFAVNPAS